MATLFPNASKPKVLTLALRAGVDIVRLNCSYFEKDAYEDIISRVRTFQERDDVQIMIDLQGIKFRISSIDKYRCHRNAKDVRFLRLSQGDCMEFGIVRDENDQVVPDDLLYLRLMQLLLCSNVFVSTHVLLC